MSSDAIIVVKQSNKNETTNNDDGNEQPLKTEMEQPECLYCNSKSVELFKEDLSKAFPSFSPNNGECIVKNEFELKNLKFLPTTENF